MDKFVVKRVYNEQSSFRRIAVRQSTYEAIEQIKDATGLPWVDLLDAMTTFCAERLEIKDE